MKIWILRPLKESLWEPWYDKAFGFVIGAETEAEARAIAQNEGGDEIDWDDIPAWTDPLNSSCVELQEPHQRGVILRDFRSA